MNKYNLSNAVSNSINNNEGEFYVYAINEVKRNVGRR